MGHIYFKDIMKT